jgi:hypothetical protein
MSIMIRRKRELLIMPRTLLLTTTTSYRWHVLLSCQCVVDPHHHARAGLVSVLSQTAERSSKKYRV